jgi:hypothetical protein
MTDKREPNPNATIQLDAVNADDVELEDQGMGTTSEEPVHGPSKSRVTPPPLPPGLSQPPPVIATVTPPQKSRALVYGVAFVVLLVVMITLGVKVGGSLRPSTPPAASSQAASPTPTNSVQPTPTKQTITIPTIEMNDQPDAG